MEFTTKTEAEMEATIQNLIAQAHDAESRIQPAETQNEREKWQRIAADWWQQVCAAEEAAGL